MTFSEHLPQSVSGRAYGHTKTAPITHRDSNSNQLTVVHKKIIIKLACMWVNICLHVLLWLYHYLYVSAKK